MSIFFTKLKHAQKMKHIINLKTFPAYCSQTMDYDALSHVFSFLTVEERARSQIKHVDKQLYRLYGNEKVNLSKVVSEASLTRWRDDDLPNLTYETFMKQWTAMNYMNKDWLVTNPNDSLRQMAYMYLNCKKVDGSWYYKVDKHERHDIYYQRRYIVKLKDECGRSRQRITSTILDQLLEDEAAERIERKIADDYDNDATVNYRHADHVVTVRNHKVGRKR